MDFTLTAPEWAYITDSATVADNINSIVYDVYYNGVREFRGAKDLSASTIMTTDHGQTYKVSGYELTASSGEGAKMKDDDALNYTVSIVIVEINWKAAKVVVQDSNKRELSTEGNTNASLPLTGSNTLKFDLNTSDSTTTGVKYDVTGLTENIKDKEMTAANIGAEETVGTTLRAKGGEAVVITVKSAVKQIFNVTAQDLAVAPSSGTGTLTSAKTNGVNVTGLKDGDPGWDIMVGITPQTGTVNEGASFAYTITASNMGADRRLEKLVVHYALKNGTKTTKDKVEFAPTYAGTASETITVLSANGDLDLSITDIEVVLKSFFIESVKVNSTSSVTLVFTEVVKALSPDIAYGTGDNLLKVDGDGSSKSWTLDESCISGIGTKEITITAKSTEATAKALEDGAKITVDAPFLNAKGKQVKACTITLTDIEDRSQDTIVY